MLLLVSACKPPSEEGIPSYIHVPAFDVFTTSPDQGTTSHNIKDVWLYLNDNLQGVYELPVTIPILATGPTKLTFSPGIFANGISTTRVQYPFYTDTIMIVDLVATETDTIRPAVTYRSTSAVVLNEDFENGNEFSNLLRISDPTLAFEGSAFGKFAMDSTRNTRVITSNKIEITRTDGSILFMEFNYRSSHLIQAGIVAEKDGEGSVVITKVNIPAQAEWNKIYLNFTPEINGTLANRFQFFLEVTAGGADPVDIYIDNVKILLD